MRRGRYQAGARARTIVTDAVPPQPATLADGATVAPNERASQRGATITVQLQPGQAGDQIWLTAQGPGAIVWPGGRLRAGEQVQLVNDGSGWREWARRPASPARSF